MTVTVSLLAEMEDLEMVDYSSDRMDSTDIWAAPGGSLIEQRVDFPRVGQEVWGPVRSETLGLDEGFSTSVLLACSPLAPVSTELLGEVFIQQPEVLSELSWWPEDGSSLLRNLGFLTFDQGGGSGAVEDHVLVLKEGKNGQVLQGNGHCGGSSADEQKVSLGEAEQRGFGSPAGTTLVVVMEQWMI